MLATKTIPELIDWRAREIRQEPGTAGEYALLLGATFQAQDRTLRDQELQAWSVQIVETVAALGARLRT
jgi:phenylalanyl-tRNA synthetase beta chain